MSLYEFETKLDKIAEPHLKRWKDRKSKVASKGLWETGILSFKMSPCGILITKEKNA